MDNYVERAEFIQTVSEIHVKVNEINNNVKELKSDVTEMAELSKRLRRILVESNGRESVIDTVRRHDRELNEVISFVNDQRANAEKKWKMVVDTFWKYLIRIVVVGTLVSFLTLMAEHSTILNQFIKEVLK